MSEDADEYTCGHCGGTFSFVRNGEWSEEQVEAEAVEFFGASIPVAERVVVCDDCYQRIMEWAANQEAGIVETAERMRAGE